MLSLSHYHYHHSFYNKYLFSFFFVTLFGLLGTEEVALCISETSATISLPKFHAISWNFNIHQQYRRTLVWTYHRIKSVFLKIVGPAIIFLGGGRCDPTWVMAFSFLRFLDHTQRRSTVGRTPLDKWSARRRDLYLTTHITHNRQTSMPPVGFETTISAGEGPQTYALDRAATGTGKMSYFIRTNCFLGF